MKKIAILILSLIVIICGLGIWQQDNIKVIINTQKFTTQELKDSYINEKAKLEAKLKTEIENPIRDFTEEELEQAKNNEAYKENLINTIKEEAKSNNSTEKEEIINNALGQLYSLKASMIGSLDSLLSQAKSEYLSLPSEQRNNKTKLAIANKYISQATSIEKTADAKVSAILSDLESELKSIGESTTIIREIKSAYEGEKSARKSYYLSLLQ